MESSRNTPDPIAIWTMTDGRAGNLAQALGLAEAVARHIPARITAQEVRPARLAALMPARLWHALRAVPGWPEAGLARDCPAPAPPWPDLIIGAGRRAAPFVAALGRRHGVRTVQILDPKMDAGAFDLIVAPEHDALAAPNAVATLGSVGRITPDAVAAAAARLAAFMPARVWHGLRAVPGWPEAGLARDCPAPAPPWPDLIIGAGRRAAPFVAALGRRHGVRTVQILDPQMDAGAFDLIVAPEHDALAAPNAVATLGSVGRITPDAVAAAAARLAPRIAHLPPRRLAVLVGGPGPSARWDAGDGTRLVEALMRLSTEGWGLMVTTSRRTDPALARALADRLDPTRALVFTGAGENPYPGLLGLAEAVLVTADSVNMASEAASTGLPVHVFAVARPSAKARAFHAALAARGIARAFDGGIGGWRYPPLAEADRVARIVLDRLFPGRADTVA